MCLTSTPYRSVKDYPNERDIERALQTVPDENELVASALLTDDDDEVFESPLPSQTSLGEEDRRDWVIPNADPETSMQQSVEHELQRLVVLKSYYALDMDEEARRPFQKICRLLRRSTRAQHAFIDLVDMGRTHVFASTMQDETVDVPRRETVCSHCIISTQDVCVIPDCSLDHRFKHLGGIQALSVKFCAAMPLISEQGYKIGIIAFFDTKPRPGLTEEETETLSEMRDLAMDALERHRALTYQQERMEAASKRVLSAAHDLLTPLTGVELSLSMLAGDADFNTHLSASQQDSFTTAASCTRIMKDICETLRCVPRETRSGSGSADSLARAPVTLAGESPRSLCHTRQLLHQRLLAVATALRKRVPIVVHVQEAVPHNIVTDEVVVFRILLKLVTNACERAETGVIQLSLTVRDTDHAEPYLFFEVETEGQPLAPEEQTCFFEGSDCMTDPSSSTDSGASSCFHTSSALKQTHAGLQSIASQIKSLQGEYGATTSANQGTNKLWFSIPLLLPEDTGETERAIRHHRKRSIDRIAELTSSIRASHEGSSEDGEVAEITTSAAQKKRRVKQKEDGDDATESTTSLIQSCLQASAAPEEPSTPAVPTALVIDDSLVVRKTLSRALSRLGYETMQAQDGMKGLELLQKHQFDLTLCDFLMPVMDGMDCVREYRKWEREQAHVQQAAGVPRRRHQYIVGISAHASPRDIERGLGIGMDAFRSKPISFDELKVLQSHADLFNGAWSLEQQIPERGSSPTPVSRRQSRILSDCWRQEGQAEKICLVATGDASSQSQCQSVGDEFGWKTVSVDNGIDALQLLKKRNWGAVLLDSGLPGVDGYQCVAQFRAWEQQNRVHRQGNLHLIGPQKEFLSPPLDHSSNSSDTSDSSKRSLSKAQQQQGRFPEGSIDGTVGKHVSRECLVNIFLRAVDEAALQALDIVSR